MAKRKKYLTVNVELPDAYEQMKRLGVDEDGDVQDAATGLVMENLPDFMPRDSGRLIGGMRKRKANRIHIDGPYARFLFFGVRADGSPVDYSAQKNPKGGPNWDRRMAAERGEMIAHKLGRYVRRRK